MTEWGGGRKQVITWHPLLGSTVPPPLQTFKVSLASMGKQEKS